LPLVFRISSIRGNLQTAKSLCGQSFPDLNQEQGLQPRHMFNSMFFSALSAQSGSASWPPDFDAGKEPVHRYALFFLS
jgi:hypothetical protein